MKTFTATIAAILLLGTASARAQDAGVDATAVPPAPAVTPAPVPPPPPPPAPPSPIAAAAATEPPPAAPASEGGGPGPVERLPPSAYPEQYTRGLYGGSLWSTFHGAQWPYYARTGIGVSGYVWIDNSFEQINIGNPAATSHRIREQLQQGRLLVRVTPTYSLGDFFVQAQAELVSNKDQSLSQNSIPNQADADDVWARIGAWRKWDVMLGRFEAFEVYHRGMGLDINTEERQGAFDDVNRPPDIYGATYLFDRPARPGNVAFHGYPTPWLRFELLAQYGGLGPYNEIGGRPAAVYDIGWLKVKAAAEYQWLTPRNELNKDERRNRGVAAAVQFVYSTYVEGGINYGYSRETIYTLNGIVDSTASNDRSSIGAFVNARLVDIAGALRRRLNGEPAWHDDLLLGLGINYVSRGNEHLNPQTGSNDFATNTQAFAALQYLIRKQLFVKLVGAYANSRFEQSFTNTAPYNDEMWSARLRVLYLF